MAKWQVFPIQSTETADVKCLSEDRRVFHSTPSTSSSTLVYCFFYLWIQFFSKETTDWNANGAYNHSFNWKWSCLFLRFLPYMELLFVLDVSIHCYLHFTPHWGNPWSSVLDSLSLYAKGNLIQNYFDYYLWKDTLCSRVASSILKTRILIHF